MIEQRSPEWFAQRAGKITASRFIDVVSRTRAGQPTADRTRYLRELVFERTSGTPKHELKGRALAWGTDVEDFAREAYELQTGHVVRRAEFTQHARYPFIGSSADGLVDPDGGIEAKCPHDEAVHIATWLDGMPAEHMPQVQGNMAVHGRSWWDFISYDPRQAQHLRLYVQRIPRDDAYIARLIAELEAFEAEVAAAVERLNRKAA